MLGCSNPSTPDVEISKVEEGLVASDWPADGLVATNRISVGIGVEITATMVTVRQTNAAGAELVLSSDARINGNVRADSLTGC